MEYTIIVTAKLIDEKVNIEVAQVQNDLPLLSFRQMSHLLVDSISLLVKLAEEKEGIKDYVLMKELVDHLNKDFISLDSFQDGTIINEKPKRIRK